MVICPIEKWQKGRKQVRVLKKINRNSITCCRRCQRPHVTWEIGQSWPKLAKIAQNCKKFPMQLGPTFYNCMAFYELWTIVCNFGHFYLANFEQFCAILSNFEQFLCNFAQFYATLVDFMQIYVTFDNFVQFFKFWPTLANFPCDMGPFPVKNSTHPNHNHPPSTNYTLGLCATIHDLL
jgi:hypothetical protein